MCGRLVDPGFENRQVTRPRIVESPRPRLSHRNGKRKKSGVILATILIVAGASAIELSSLVINDLNDHLSDVENLFEAAILQAYVVAAVGVGVMIYHLLPRPEEAMPLLRRANLTDASRADHEILPSGVPPERRLGTGIRALLYFLSVLSPFVGSIAGAVLYTRVEPDYEHVGKICIVLAAVLVVVGAVVGVLLYFAFGTPSGSG